MYMYCLRLSTASASRPKSNFYLSGCVYTAGGVYTADELTIDDQSQIDDMFLIFYDL